MPRLKEPLEPGGCVPSSWALQNSGVRQRPLGAVAIESNQGILSSLKFLNNGAS